METHPLLRQNPALREAVRGFLAKSKEESDKALGEAFRRVRDKAKTERKKSAKKTGSVSLSNTDSVSRCTRIKAQLSAKLAEIYASDLDNKVKDALTRDIMLQLNKVEQKAIEIIRRERALQEEKNAKRSEPDQVKRRRQHDLAKRSTAIRRDYLYSAEKGGFDPNDPLLTGHFAGAGLNTATAFEPAVAFDIGGTTGEAAAVADSAGFEAAR